MEKFQNGIILPLDLDQMINWRMRSVESIEPALIIKAFETCCVSRPLNELLDRNLLSQRLFTIVEDYLFMCDSAAGEEEFVYNDPREAELKSIFEGQELHFE